MTKTGMWKKCGSMGDAALFLLCEQDHYHGRGHGCCERFPIAERAAPTGILLQTRKKFYHTESAIIFV